MATRYDHDDGAWIVAQRRPGEADESPLPSLGDTLAELALTAAGFVGVIMLITAALRALR